MPTKSKIDHSNKLVGILKRTLIVIAVLLGISFAGTFITNRFFAPEIEYSLSRFSCPTEEAGKNKTCDIVIKIQNNEDSEQLLDFADISGPGFVDWNGKNTIRIYDENKNYCFGNASYVTVPARQSAEIELECGLDDRYPGINDLTIDERPVKVVINYYNKTEINLSQKSINQSMISREQNQQVLDSITANGRSLDEIFIIEHHFVGADIRVLQEMAETYDNKNNFRGLGCAGGVCFVDLLSKTSLSLDIISQETELMESISKQFGVIYDGWGVSLERPSVSGELQGHE